MSVHSRTPKSRKKVPLKPWDLSTLVGVILNLCFPIRGQLASHRCGEPWRRHNSATDRRKYVNQTTDLVLWAGLY